MFHFKRLSHFEILLFASLLSLKAPAFTGEVIACPQQEPLKNQSHAFNASVRDTKAIAAHVSGQKHKAHAQNSSGIASVYGLGDPFTYKRTAYGVCLDPTLEYAASLTLPKGTIVKVTNPANGRSTLFVIVDRGPHVKGRIIDLASAKADEIGLSPLQTVHLSVAGHAEIVEADPCECVGDTKDVVKNGRHKKVDCGPTVSQYRHRNHILPVADK